ncbi:RusA family crossover junction endodeoxyribonuclease [Corynebacterium sp. AOP40-9SA-29]|uniref:RusA family crossover junction endodeoxyribonuclease n=1 Tax=Corynebacterium sp. AOP40-9SA-29 TaxID=3457677 RepID=UPI0040342A46
MTTFFVNGTPAPQGSKNAYRRGGRTVLVESSKKVKPWRAAVAQVAALMCPPTPIDGPVFVAITFVLPRPKSLPKRIIHMVKKPDLDKLVRSTLDALSGIAYVDDNRVTSIYATKRYAINGSPPGAQITIEGDTIPMTDPETNPETTPALVLTATRKTDTFAAIVGGAEFNICVQTEDGMSDLEGLYIIAQALGIAADKVLATSERPSAEKLLKIMNLPADTLAMATATHATRTANDPEADQ